MRPLKELALRGELAVLGAEAIWPGVDLIAVRQGTHYTVQVLLSS